MFLDYPENKAGSWEDMKSFARKYGAPDSVIDDVAKRLAGKVSAVGWYRWDSEGYNIMFYVSRIPLRAGDNPNNDNDEGKSTYTVTFDADGGTFSGGGKTQTLTVKGSATVAYSEMPANPSKEGYSFAGWYTSYNGQGAMFTDHTTVSGDRTVYAKWGDAGKYMVFFDSDGGDACQPIMLDAGASAGFLLYSPKRSTFLFDGWYTEPDGGGTQFTASTTVNASIIVYAKWMKIGSCIITFDADGEHRRFGGDWFMAHKPLKERDSLRRLVDRAERRRQPVYRFHANLRRHEGLRKMGVLHTYRLPAGRAYLA
jgi:uncharacterized repeat protein (TIGR02543 family)